MCLGVPNEIFYVRRNGKAAWTGNSRARGNMTNTTRQPEGSNGSHLYTDNFLKLIILFF
jgi:hypothetical protein